MNFVLVFILAGALWWQGCGKSEDPGATRQAELAGILKRFLKPQVESYWDADVLAPAGWWDPTNQMDIKAFIAKYPATEEAYQAELWVTHATDAMDPQDTAAARRQSMIAEWQRISRQASRPGTQKMAALARAYKLFDEGYMTPPRNGTAAGFEAQANDILAHIQDYETERDREFLRYLEMIEVRPLEIEPCLRYLIIYEKGYHQHWDEALALAKSLRQKFPRYDGQSVNSEIWALESAKRGWRPDHSITNINQI